MDLEECWGVGINIYLLFARCFKDNISFNLHSYPGDKNYYFHFLLLRKLSLPQATCLGAAIFKLPDLLDTQIHTGWHSHTVTGGG